MHTYTFLPIQYRPPWGSSKINMDHTPFILTLSIFPLKMSDKYLHFNTNIIVGSFAGGGSFSSPRKKYAMQVFVANVISFGSRGGTQREKRANITFSIRTPIDSTLTIMTHWSSLCIMATRISNES